MHHLMPEATRSPRVTGEPQLALLLVEDHEATAIIMTKLLRRRGHTVLTARTCAEAEASCAAQKFDCLISDLSLPDGSGHDLMRAMRDRYRITGIAISGSGSDTDIERAHASGFARHFTKPIDIDQLQCALLELAAAAPARA